MGRDNMKCSKTVKTKIFALMKEKGLSINKVATNGNLTTSTLNTFLNNRSEYCSVKTLQKICQGLSITLYDFFNDELFKNIDDEE